jgi:putative DNA modification/repair radical SAM protein
VDTERKLDLLASAARFDVCGYSGLRDAHQPAVSPMRFLYKAALPNGRTACLFKVLLTSVCTNDCSYCVNQAGRDIPRTWFQPEELAQVFMELHRRKLAQGLFLSSGIAGSPSKTMESMIKTVEILRERHDFRGYVHLKVLPGASFDCVEQACKVANRVSVNIEAPTERHLARLSSKKAIYNDIVERMRWMQDIMAANQGVAPSGQTTQFVVGASGETDRDIVRTTSALYREVDLRRAYFSAFQPVSRSPLEGVPAAPPMRQHRLYQADWLLRIYRFTPHEVELGLGADDNFSLKRDPKMVIAVTQPWLFPVDVNTASYEELLRVPGIGPISAGRIVEARRDFSITSLEQLRKMGVVTKRAVSYVRYQSMLPEEKQACFLPQLDEEVAEETPTLATAVR